MKKRIIWLVLSCLMAAALILSSCQSATEEETEGQTVTGQVTEKGTPTTTTPKEETKETTAAAPTKTTGPQYGGTITLTATTDAVYLDPWNGSMGCSIVSFSLEKLAMGDWGVDRNVFDFKGSAYIPLSLYRGHIAESWEQTSLTSFVLHIRKGVNWQNLPPMNGRELTAYDVEWSYHRSLGLGSGFTEGTPNSSTMIAMPWESVTALDKYTVEVKLTQPNVAALESFLCESYEASWIYPREVIEQYGDLNDWQHFVGSGPYMIADHVADASWTFTKNPDYWCYDEKYPENKLPYADEVKWLIIPDVSTQLAALRSGKIDVMGGIKKEQSDSLKKTNPELSLITILGSNVSLPMRVDKAPFDDIRVRKAMQMALDLDTIAGSYYGGEADPTPYGELGPACAGYYVPYDEWPEDVKAGFEYNPEGAKALLAEAGYPNGFTVTYDCCPGFRADTDLAQVIKSYFGDVGVTMEINVVELSPYIGKVYSQSVAELGSWWNSWAYSPIGTVKCKYYSPSVWAVGCQYDSVFDAIVDAADAAVTVEEQMGLIKEADMYSIERFWELFLPRGATFIAQQPWFKGYNGENTMGGGQFSARWARCWVDQDLK